MNENGCTRAVSAYFFSNGYSSYLFYMTPLPCIGYLVRAALGVSTELSGAHGFESLMCD